MAKTFLKKETLFLGALFLLALVLRLWSFGRLPPAMFGDEVDTGYQAFSLWRTGRDYFGNLWPVHFQSFGDWRMPLYIYLAAPFVGLFGLSEWATRLPSLIFSLGQIALAYLLAKEISGQKKIAWLTALFLSFSPWSFHFSRLALEVTLFNFLFLLGLWFFLRASSRKDLLFPLGAAITWGFSLYAYSTAKLFLPLFLAALFLLFFSVKIFSRRQFSIFMAVLGLIVLPMFIAVFWGEGGARFSNISIFKEESVPDLVELERRECPWTGFWERLWHNKAWQFAGLFLENYFRSFSSECLFLTGDPSPRHNPAGVGQLSPAAAPFILAGGWFLISRWRSRRDPKLLLPFVVLFLTPLPAALTQDGGTHAIRTYQFLPWWQFLVAWGVFGLWQTLKTLKLRMIIFGFTALAEMIFLANFFHFYLVHFPQTINGRWWNEGYRELFEFLNPQISSFDEVYLSPAVEAPIVYVLFYHRFDPSSAQAEMSISPQSLGKFRFFCPEPDYLRSWATSRQLFVCPPGELAIKGFEPAKEPGFQVLKQITYPNGEVIFNVFQKTK